MASKSPSCNAKSKDLDWNHTSIHQGSCLLGAGNLFKIIFFAKSCIYILGWRPQIRERFSRTSWLLQPFNGNFEVEYAFIEQIFEYSIFFILFWAWSTWSTSYILEISFITARFRSSFGIYYRCCCFYVSSAHISIGFSVDSLLICCIFHVFSCLHVWHSWINIRFVLVVLAMLPMYHYSNANKNRMMCAISCVCLH